MRIALSLTGDRDRAADLTQETLVRAFRAFDRFRPGAEALPWLARIMRNLHLDSFKTGRARHELAEHQLTAQHSEPLGTARAAAPSPLAQVEQAQLLRLVEQELAQLSEDQRVVLTLCDIEGMSYAEAADVMEVPVGTVRSRLSRAREQIRARVASRLAPRPQGHEKKEEPMRSVGRNPIRSDEMF